MLQEVRILECSHKSGTSKTSGKLYSFYVGKLYGALGVLEFISNDEFEVDIDSPISVEITQKDGKFTIIKV